jgi:molybdopterin-containing oxidoreductase family iron-sulfur binding subunit
VHFQEGFGAVTCASHFRTAISPAGAAPEAQHFWRSLEELSGAREFEEALAREFPRHAAVWDASTDRRRFLELMGASLALAGMHGCAAPPPEPILPYVRAPTGMTPGVAMHFATAMPRPSGALGVVATSHMGRPTKIEGNALHPASLGATDAAAQASVLTLYDPDRSQTVKRLGEISTWSAILGAIREALEFAGDGAGLRVLSEPINSPTLLRQRQAFLDRYPGARWHEYEPVSRASVLAGADRAFGRPLAPVYQIGDADVVLSLDSDFLCSGPGAVRYARDFMARRGAEANSANRLYVVETALSPTGAAADHRLPLAPSGVAAFASALAARLGVGEALASNVDERWLAAVAEDLEQHRGQSLVVAGDHQPAAVHALAHAVNAALGNIGATVSFIDPIAPLKGQPSLAELTQDLNAGDVDWLLLLDVNPVYDAPADLDFPASVRRARQAIHVGIYDDETADLCHWHVPAAHYLELWSDARAFDGTASIVQPLITPLYGGKTPHEVLSAVLETTPRSSYELVRETWQESFGDEFERRWHQALGDGVVAGSAFPLQAPTVDAANVASRVAALPVESAGGDEFELALLPDPCVGDGRLANNGWLQELPKPISKLTWVNALLMGPADAERLGLEAGDVVQLAWRGREVVAPVCIVPGHAAGALTCHFGYGRRRAGKTGSGRGFSAYGLTTTDSGYIGGGATLTKTGERLSLARTQQHHAIDGRNIVHTSTVAEFRRDPDAVLPEALHHELPSLYADYEYDGFSWGMAIDLSKCMGCNACVVACQAENNIPIVGKEQVERGREMHWLRLDLYYSGLPENPEAVHQPMLCQHCERAPCEVVCPVAATTHSDEGLNEMTYNRCIGTRYCSNNCPYKVRRFNFFDYTGERPAVLELLQNPDVTVRSRGVMEKCTYCVQRINRARIEAKKQAVESGERARIEDGSLQTACQQACPAEAIAFGDINDAQSRVSRLKADPLNYGVLSELGTRPRTTYLARLRNPNPRLE